MKKIYYSGTILCLLCLLEEVHVNNWSLIQNAPVYTLMGDGGKLMEEQVAMLYLPKMVSVWEAGGCIGVLNAQLITWLKEGLCNWPWSLLMRKVGYRIRGCWWEILIFSSVS